MVYDMTTYLIAHTNPDGTGVAQKTLAARNIYSARNLFRELWPQRVVLTIGIRGETIGAN